MKKYTLQDTSNSNIKRVCDRNNNWLHYHLVKENKDLRAVNYILDKGYAKGLGFYTALKNSSPEEWDKKLEKAGDKGDAVHQSIRTTLQVGKFSIEDKVLSENNKDTRVLTFEEWECILAFGRFWNDHDMKLVDVEQTVADEKNGFAGTLDMIATMRKSCGGRYCDCTPHINKLGLWDHKSGSGIYENYGAQLAAYESAQLGHLHRYIEYTAIDHLGTNHKVGYKLEFYDLGETAKHWKEFLAAKTIHDATYKPFVLEAENENIPDLIELKQETKAELLAQTVQVLAKKFNSRNGMVLKPKLKLRKGVRKVRAIKNVTINK